MRKPIFVILVAALLLTAGPTADAWTNRLVNNFYTDATFSSACGWDDTNCGGIWDYESDGCHTDYRYHEVYNCSTEERVSAECEEWNGTQWVAVACPDEGVTAQTRVHITVG